MNNEQFRKLMLASSANKSRSVGNTQAEFARQVAERNRALHPQKKFKSSTPRGVKLGEGYIDRSQRADDDGTDDREERLKALAKSLKDEEIDEETYEKLRFQIAGGDLESTHLVKGLDFKLLARIRQGEDVYQNGGTRENAEEAVPEDDVDDEFERLEGQEIRAVEREKAAAKRGQLSTVSPAVGTKRTRDQILAKLKASRLAAQAKQEAALGDRFKKIGETKLPGRRIERDHKGREVLIIIDEDGHEKRKVRKIQPSAEDNDNGLLMPDKNAKPLGMEVPEQYRKKEEPEEEDGHVDIFDDVGDEYDPLAGMNDSDSDDSNDDDDQKSNGKEEGEAEEDGEDGVDEQDEDAKARGSMPPPSKPSVPRNYFQDSKTGLISEQASKGPSMSDPAMLAAIKKAASLRQIKTDEETDKAEAELKARKLAEERRKKLLATHDRDDDDIDMGFGTSRFEDEEDFADNSKVKLSKWKDGDGDGDGDGDSDGRERGRGGAKRKRGPKKRKGDGNNAADVMRVMEQRKKA
ncbi:Protein Red [Escovopsis weberi]|uniref:Protein Red n=1 Tax=Escovopsis weberi TaxID=150374 RepID=A0A0M8MY09_ESCWE|nr:Protein Red [Escovopsis weberi]